VVDECKGSLVEIGHGGGLLKPLSRSNVDFIAELKLGDGKGGEGGGEGNLKSSGEAGLFMYFLFLAWNPDYISIRIMWRTLWQMR
jgi:hypothetical protein